MRGAGGVVGGCSRKGGVRRLVLVTVLLVFLLPGLGESLHSFFVQALKATRKDK